MPKPSDYTPTRRYLMQAVMTLVLAATIALAAAVSSRARRVNRVELAPEAITARGITVRLPQQWRRTAGDPKDVGLVAEAVEALPAGDDDDDSEADPADAAARTVSVRVERLPTPQSPLAHLLTKFDEVPIAGPRGRRRTPEEWLVPIPMAGYSGVMMTAERGARRRGGAIRKDVVAVVVLPSQRAVTVHLEGVGEADANDHAVVKAIAAAITLADEPPLGKPGEIVTLPDGIRFAAPRRFAPVADTDPSRTDRRLWLASATAAAQTLDELESRWLSIETVGCVCPDFDASDPKQAERAKAAFATLLLVHDARLRGATITPLGNKTWRAETASIDEPGGARGFLLTHPSGRALLTIVRRGIGHEDVDAVWRDIAPTVEFLPAGDVASLEDLGASEAARLRRAGYERLLADRDLAWWRWTEGDTYIGWSNTDFPSMAKPGASAPGLSGKSQQHLRLANSGSGDRITHLVHDFSYRDAAAPRYTSTVAREQIQGDQRGKFIQQTTLADNQLSMTFQPPGGPAAQLWNNDPAPAQFVPGALLPLVLHQLPRDPLILLTDTFPGREGIGPAQPLTLIIRPGDDATPSTRTTTTTTTTTATAEPPLRCITVQLNGAGTVSRWYFRRTGELERVDWGAGLQQLASDESAVKNTFPKGDALAP